MIDLAKQQPELKKKTPSQLQQQRNSALGSRGEQAAANFLRHRGYSLLAQNVIFKKFELDIVCFDPHHDTVVFVEVKTRSNKDFGHPAQAVNYRKMRCLRQAAVQYMQAERLEKQFRFAIICITPGNIEFFDNVTWP